MRSRLSPASSINRCSIASRKNPQSRKSRSPPNWSRPVVIRWTVRRDGHNQYYVDETIGENSVPVVSGPLTGDAAIKFVDDRESEARQRFEDLKSEMAGRTAAANLVRKDAGEI